MEISRTSRRLRVHYIRHPGSIWIEEHPDELPRDKWVAADESGLRAIDDTINGLSVQIRDLNISQEDIAIAFITSDAI